MDEMTSFIKNMDDKALIYAFIKQKDLYNEEELTVLQNEINRRDLVISEDYSKEIEAIKKEDKIIAQQVKREQQKQKEKAFSENTSSMSYQELKEALASKDSYSKEELDRLQKEYSRRNEQARIIKKNIDTSDNVSFPTADTKNISSACTITKICFFIFTVLFIISGSLVLGFGVEKEIDFLIPIGIFIILLSLISSLIYSVFVNVLFGLFYDARKIRMMMEENRTKK